MNPRVVCDASSVVALLLDSGSDGQWATRHLAGSDLAAPGLVVYEAANIIRRHALANLVTNDQAAQAHTDLRDLAIELWPYEAIAARCWHLRANLSIYDASYVALAELIGATLVTLDRRLSGAPGVRCSIATP